MFPNVPQEHRALIEPHIREMSGHVTQLEQQLAPFKPFLEAGMTPEEAQGVLTFNRNFDQNPLQTWLDLGKYLQGLQGQNGRTVVDADVDLDYLAALARGEDPDAGQAPAAPDGPAGPPTDQGTTTGWTEREQQLFGAVQQLQRQVAELSDGVQQDRTTQQQRVMDQLHGRRLEKMRSELAAAGYKAEDLTDEVLNAHVLTARGRFDVATQQLVDYRNRILQSVTPSTEPTPPELPNGAPSSPSRREKPRQGDAWGQGRKEAEARLKRLNAPG